MRRMGRLGITVLITSTPKEGEDLKTRGWIATAVAVLMVLCGGAATAQDWPAQFDPTTDRESGMRMLVWDPAINENEGGYVVISFDNLLAGLVDFPDMLTRYVTASVTLGHMFTVGELTAGLPTATTSPGELTCAPYPTIAGATGGYVAVAAPTAAGLPFYCHWRTVQQRLQPAGVLQRTGRESGADPGQEA